jgi:hypothetical protein
VKDDDEILVEGQFRQAGQTFLCAMLRPQQPCLVVIKEIEI